MEQRLSLLTLGVSDLRRSSTFYAALGWKGHEVDDTVFFQLGGMVVALWSRTKLAADCGLEDDGPPAFGGMVLAHNVRSTDEVDAVLAEAEAAGAVITRPAAATFYGGYAGVFVDPDGHPWEVAHNPGFRLNDDGSLELPRFGGENDEERQ